MAANVNVFSFFEIIKKTLYFGKELSIKTNNFEYMCYLF